MRRNSNLKRAISSPKPDSELFKLFKRYVSIRHDDGGMDDMEFQDFKRMAEDSPTRTRIIKYFDHSSEGSGGSLVAAALTDVLQDGLSMLYSFYDPDRTRNSLGTYMVLDHIDIARTNGFKHVYLGYWVPGSQKMNYKRKFDSLEIYVDRLWRDLSECNDVVQNQLIESDGCRTNNEQ